MADSTRTQKRRVPKQPKPRPAEEKLAREPSPDPLTRALEATVEKVLERARKQATKAPPD